MTTTAFGLDGHDLHCLRYAVSGGAPCPIPVIEALRKHGVLLAEGFGLTETAPVAAVLSAEHTLSHAGSIGKAVLHTELRIVDENDSDIPRGEIGELLIRGPNVLAGYWQKPDATAKALRGGWFHTGDMARQDDEGFYYIVDRKKDMIISGGENVYPTEVEQALYLHPAIREVAVIGTPDAKWGEAVTAVVALKPDATLTADALIAWIRDDRLAHFKCPRSVHFVDALPRTATGKVLKRALRQQWNGSPHTAHR